MPIERFVCLAGGVGLMLAILAAGAHHIPAPWDKVAHFVVFALITALLWVGTEGEAPVVVAAAVIAFGAIDEIRQLYVPGRNAELADFLADAAAVFAASAALAAKRKRVCVESSQR
jgi:VanZ family protein